MSGEIQEAAEKTQIIGDPDPFFGITFIENDVYTQTYSH